MNPKGVIQSRENVSFFVARYIEALAITHEDRISFFSSVSFDGMVEDVYPALFTGATLYPLAIREGDNLSRFPEFMARHEITIYHSVVSVFRHMITLLTPDLHFPKLRWLVTAGEALRTSDIEQFQMHFGHLSLGHMYGMTEASVTSFFFVEGQEKVAKVYLGDPFEDVEYLLLDEEGEEVDDFETGEIFIACHHIAVGYLDDPQRTAASFLEFEEIGRLYRTGDLGRMDYNGNIEFMGRRDHQVKINGFRVETDEIERALARMEGVDATAVIAHDREERLELWAYLATNRALTETGGPYLVTSTPA